MAWSTPMVPMPSAFYIPERNHSVPPPCCTTLPFYKEHSLQVKAVLTDNRPAFRLNAASLSMTSSTAVPRFVLREPMALWSASTARSSMGFSELPSGRTFANRLAPYRPASISGLPITTQSVLMGAVEARGNDPWTLSWNSLILLVKCACYTHGML